MLLFGLLNGLGQCLKYRGATTQWQHRAQQAVDEVEEGGGVEEGGEGRMVELNEKLKKKHKENDKNAGFMIDEPFYFDGLTGWNKLEVKWLQVEQTHQVEK